MDSVNSNPTAPIRSTCCGACGATINEGLKRIANVCKNTFAEMVHRPFISLATIVAIPVAIATGYYILLAIPIGWVAYSVFKGCSTKQDTDQAIQDYFKRLHKDIFENNFIEKLEQSKSLNKFRQHLAKVVGTLEGNMRAISCKTHSCKTLFSDTLKKVEELRSNFETFVEEKEEKAEATFETSKQKFVADIKSIESAFADVVHNQLPAYLKKA